ncbi:unnamed protein product [Mytilus coruscus]|uniref:Novel STAND NTPase 3 domain-containing protein n=1 Tax=Mytilus coruscus TaxID=42192 RepID=A0A6J8EX50_MYTCO|nr:unnamed protein product [Mytilus coruscus]
MQTEELERGGLGINIGLEYCGSPLCADDIVLMTSDETEIQAMLNIAYKYSCQHRYNIHPQNSSLIKTERTKTNNQHHPITLGESPIQQEQQITRLGIIRAEIHWKHKCQLCQIEKEDIMHFILRCPALNEQRQKVLPELKQQIILLLLKICAAFYSFKCPVQSQWRHKAKMKCNSSESYACVYDQNGRNFTEFCSKNAITEKKGFKVIIRGAVDGEHCDWNFYQPFKFNSSGNSRCVYKKSVCTEKGQVIYRKETNTTTDNLCRCDYTRSYDFIHRPQHRCYCVPSIEDCFCYSKICSSNEYLSQDYECLDINEWGKNSECSPVIIDGNVETSTIISTDGQAKQGDFQDRLIIKWNKRLEHFEVTNAARKVLNDVETHGFVILSGPPGSGKSAIAYYAAFMLEKKHAFKIFPVSTLVEIRRYVLPDTKQVFLIDDVVGKYTVDEPCIQQWKNEKTFITQTITASSNTKVILTCRSYIYNSGFCCKLHVLPMHCDLLTRNLKLNIVERRQICNRYNVPELTERTVMMYDFLPLLCSIFSIQENTTAFFVNPCKVLTHDMIKTKEKSDIAYLAIALLVVKDNNIDRQILNLQNLEIVELLKDLCIECGFKYHPLSPVLLSALCDLIGTYVMETDDGFACIHDNLFRNLSFIVGGGIMHCLLKYGSSRFLANRLQLASIGHEQHDELVIIVKPEQEESYFQRLLLDIRKGNHSHVFTGIQMKYLRFRTKLLKFLILLKAEDLKCDKHKSTPLHVASEQGYEDLAHVLVELKKDQINHQDSNKRTPLYMACLGGHNKVVKELHLHDKTTLEITNNDDCTPLDAASSNGHCSTVKLLLDYGANYKKKDTKMKRTPLYRACENGHYDVVRLLLSKNPDVKHTDVKGLKAIHIACLTEHFDIVELLLSYKDMINECDAHGRTPLFIACESNQQKMVELLLEHNANVNQTNKENMTPLHKACQIRNEVIVGRLLDKTAKVNVQSVYGLSPLYISCLEGTLNIVNILLNQKADVNLATKQGWTPFLISCSEDHLEICKSLQHSGANINTADKFEFTPLHIACREKHERIVRFLLEHNANVNAVNRKKESPLYISCMNESSEIVELLLEKNADVNICEENGNCPLHAACLKGNKQIVQLLLNKKADIHKRNNVGKTPFDVLQGRDEDSIDEMLNRNKKM